MHRNSKVSNRYRGILTASEPCLINLISKDTSLVLSLSGNQFFFKIDKIYTTLFEDDVGVFTFAS